MVKQYSENDVLNINNKMNESIGLIDNFIATNKEIPELADVNTCLNGVRGMYENTIANYNRVIPAALGEAQRFSLKASVALDETQSLKNQIKSLTNTINVTGSLTERASSIMSAISKANEYELMARFGTKSLEELLAMDVSILTEEELNQLRYAIISKLDGVKDEEQYLAALEKIKPGILDEIQKEIDAYDITLDGKKIEINLIDFTLGGTKVKLDFSFELLSKNADKLTLSAVLFNDTATVKASLDGVNYSTDSMFVGGSKEGVIFSGKTSGIYEGIKTETSVSINLSDILRGEGNITAKTSSSSEHFKSNVTLKVTSKDMYAYATVGTVLASTYELEIALQRVRETQLDWKPIAVGAFVIMTIGGVYVVVTTGDFTLLHESYQKLVETAPKLVEAY